MMRGSLVVEPPPKGGGLLPRMEFALVGIVLFMIVGTLLVYILLNIGIEMEKAAMLAGIITAILIVVVDDKKIHTVNKITECNRRIFMRIGDKIMKRQKVENKLR